MFRGGNFTQVPKQVQELAHIATKGMMIQRRGTLLGRISMIYDIKYTSHIMDVYGCCCNSIMWSITAVYIKVPI